MSEQTSTQELKAEKAPSIILEKDVPAAPEPESKPEQQEEPPKEASTPEEQQPTTATPTTTTETKSESAPAPEPESQPEPKSEEEEKEKETTKPAEETVAPTDPAPPAAAAATAATTESSSNKPEYLTKTPALEQFFEHLPAILTKTAHDEMWGVVLKDSTDIPTVNILIKFLRANNGDLKLAEEQLTKALEWRKQVKPLELVEATFPATKFGGLGYLTLYPREGKDDLVVSWNIYGAVKNVDETFGNVDEFVKWRAALMELAVKELKMNEATSVIDYNGEDPYQMIQVHDYLNVSFLRVNPTIRAATKKTIEVFSTAYPELLREKFFVNVPAIMGWMFAAMKLFVSENTTRKFHPISNGANLAREFPALVEKFPKAYGGGGPELEGSARTVKLVEA